ncbi:MAG: response regulator, partial [Nitrospirota bacterium]|nr:response regulator [Nitrospirota bacterium]
MAGRVLVVDDDPGVRDSLSEFLATLDFQVVTAEDGEDALNHYQRGDFEIIMADLVMPKVDGMELLRRIREVDEEVIFLMITGHPSIGSAVDSINKGAEDY